MRCGSHTTHHAAAQVACERPDATACDSTHIQIAWLVYRSASQDPVYKAHLTQQQQQASCDLHAISHVLSLSLHLNTSRGMLQV